MYHLGVLQEWCKQWQVLRRPKILVVLSRQDGSRAPLLIHAAWMEAYGALEEVMPWVSVQPLRIEHEQRMACLK